MKPKQIGMFETKTHLSEIIESVERGQIFFITRRGRKVAELRPATPERQALVRGSASNPSYWMAADFDETLADFEDEL